MRSAYIYYRVQTACADTATRQVALLMQAMRPHCRMPPRALQRCDDTGTWMEIYEDIPDWPAFVAALALATAEAVPGAWLAGERHLECFQTHASVAEPHN